MEKIRDDGDIIAVPILHESRGIYYHCLFPSDLLNLLNPISEFLEGIIDSTPVYRGDKLSSSYVDLRFPENKISFRHIETPELFREIVLEGLSNPSYTRHYKVQRAFMLYDSQSIATEFPVYDEYFEGFIDLVRFGEGGIEIWDYKPGANKEKQRYVSSQLGLYGTLFSKIFDIDTAHIQLGYFDENDMFILENQCVCYDYLIDYCINKFSFLKTFAPLLMEE